jgi:WD40 repeat protein
MCAKFDHRGTQIATANMGGLVELWNVDGDKLATLRGHTSTPLYDVEFSPDDLRVVSAGQDRTSRMWDVASGKELGHVEHKDSIEGARFDLTGARFATAGEDKSAVLWDAMTFQPIRAFLHDAIVIRVGANTALLAGATSSGVVQLWDIAGGKEAGRFRHTRSATSAELDRDRLLTAGMDGRIVIWDASTSVPSPDEVVAFVCRIVGDSDVATRAVLGCPRSETAPR